MLIERLRVHMHKVFVYFWIYFSWNYSRLWFLLLLFVYWFAALAVWGSFLVTAPQIFLCHEIQH